MKNQSPETSRTRLIMIVVLAVSLILNIVLGVSALGPNKVRDDYDKDEATDKTFYEEQVQQLEAKNEGLESKIAKLEKGLAEKPEEDTSEKESKKEDVAESGKNDSGINNKRSAVYSTASSFIDNLLTTDTAKQTNEERRATLAPFVTSEVLSKIAPSDKDLADMGLVDEGHSDGDDEEAPDAYSYKQTLESKDVYVDETSLNGDTVRVLVDATSKLKDNRGSDMESKERYAIKVVEKDGKWVISDYTLDKIN